MFARRVPLSLQARVVATLFPKRGYGRAFRYIWLRFMRAHGTSHEIARGFTCGVCVGLTPLLGLHAILALVLCALVRGNYLAAVLGSLIFNPLTAVPILVIDYEIGKAFYHVFNIGIMPPMPSTFSASTMISLVQSHFASLFLPWLAGGGLVALCAAPFSYMIGMLLVRMRDEARIRTDSSPRTVKSLGQS